MTEKRSLRRSSAWENLVTASHGRGTSTWTSHEPRIFFGKVTTTQAQKHRPTDAGVPHTRRGDTAHAGGASRRSPWASRYHAYSPHVPTRSAGLGGEQLTVGVHRFEDGVVACPSAETWRCGGASAARTRAACPAQAATGP